MLERESLQTPPNYEFSDQPNEALLKGVEKARSVGFSIEESLQRDHPELGVDYLEERVEKVISTASGIAESIGVDDDFFEDSSNVMLLSAIADSWINLEDAALDGSDHSSNSRERTMLQDVALMLAGQKSDFVRSLQESGVSGSEVFVDIESNVTDKKKELNEFFDSLVNQELSNEVTSILQNFEEGSFLDKQRRMLGINESNEQPFSVKVLNFGSDEYDLKQVGALSEEPENPYIGTAQTEEEKADKEKKGKIWDKWRQAVDGITKPLKDTAKEYEDRFIDTYGSMPPAWIDKKSDGTVELVLMRHQAEALVNSEKGKDMPIQNDFDNLDRLLAFVRHEYGHTQKDLTRGEHTQLGLILEERKAELVSGDKQGYVDVKLFLRDMEMVTDHKILATLEDSLQEDDSLAYFLAEATRNIGLRDTLMFMVAKPIPYESNPDAQKYFPDTGCFRKSSDASGLDSIIRRSSEALPSEVLKARIANRVGKIVLEDFDVEFMKNEWMSYRENNGVSYINQTFKEELEQRIQQEA